MKILSAALVAAAVALAVTIYLHPPKPEPPAAWCWVGGVGGLPCKYRKRFFNI